MDETDQAPFSWAWVGVSVVVFTVFELLIGGFLSELLEGRFTSHMLRLRFEAAMSLTAYFSGGFLVGVMSPGKRLLEPAVGAAISVAFTFVIAIFTPVMVLGFSTDRILVGGVLAFGVGLFGAHLGERVTGGWTTSRRG